ncbi:MAG: GNAT family N-acetyltransferase [Pseudomonadota bacterium]
MPQPNIEILDKSPEVMMINRVISHDDLIKCYVIRGIVFCEGQDIAYNIEHDDQELGSHHFLVEIQEEPVATARMRIEPGYAKLERIAVRKKYRGQQIGAKLITDMLVFAQKQGVSVAKLNAQSHLELYYQSLGFETTGNTFEAAGIPHVPMQKKL